MHMSPAISSDFSTISRGDCRWYQGSATLYPPSCLISPAHHQIHHSIDPRHIGKNRGFDLSGINIDNGSGLSRATRVTVTGRSRAPALDRRGPREE